MHRAASRAQSQHCRLAPGNSVVVVVPAVQTQDTGTLGLHVGCQLVFAGMCRVVGQGQWLDAPASTVMPCCTPQPNAGRGLAHLVLTLAGSVWFQLQRSKAAMTGVAAGAGGARRMRQRLVDTID